MSHNPLSHNPPEDPTNPWESTWSQTDSSLQAPVADRCVVCFSGSLDRSTMAKFYGSKMQIGYVVPLVLLSALIWATILSIGFGVYGLTTVAVGVSIAIWFIAVRFIGKNQANRLCKRRPWLEGPVHGVATSGRLTVWHNDLCLQTNLRSYMSNPNRGMLVYPDPETVFPWAMIPSTCFFEHQWFDLRESCKNYRILEPLIYQVPPPDGHSYILTPKRSWTLKNRTRALSFRPNGGFLIGFAILGIWLGLAQEVSGSIRSVVAIPTMVLVVLVLSGWIASEIVRYAWARFQAFSDYSNPDRSAYRQFNHSGKGRKAKLDPSDNLLQSQWFNRQRVMIADLRHWILVPVDYLQRVKVRDTWIEFVFGDQPVLFHREGFENQTAWQRAREDALFIQQRLKENQRRRPRATEAT